MTSNSDDAELYRLAQANKMMRLGLVTVTETGEIVPTAAMEEMDDGPITPDAIDFEAVRRR